MRTAFDAGTAHGPMHGSESTYWPEVWIVSRQTCCKKQCTNAAICVHHLRCIMHTQGVQSLLLLGGKFSSLSALSKRGGYVTQRYYKTCAKHEGKPCQLFAAVHDSVVRVHGFSYTGHLPNHHVDLDNLFCWFAGNQRTKFALFCSVVSSTRTA